MHGREMDLFKLVVILDDDISVDMFEGLHSKRLYNCQIFKFAPTNLKICLRILLNLPGMSTIFRLLQLRIMRLPISSVSFPEAVMFVMLLEQNFKKEFFEIINLLAPEAPTAFIILKK